MTTRVCRQCGILARSPAATVCARCGLVYGVPPRATAELPSCPVCYRTVDPDGRLVSLDGPLRRVDLQAHIVEHDRHPVGDDEWLDTLREGDRIRIGGRWVAPYDLVRRYLVTGAVDGGRRRTFEHNTIVTAMAQLARFGPSAMILGDQAEWVAARAAVAEVKERYHQGRAVAVVAARA